jgi:hypothetical protein
MEPQTHSFKTALLGILVVILVGGGYWYVTEVASKSTPAPAVVEQTENQGIVTPPQPPEPVATDGTVTDTATGDVVQNTSEPKTESGSNSSGVASSDAVSPDATMYTDGTYTSTGTYRTPAGNEEVDITLTLKNGLIADATGVNRGRDPKSKKFQQLFLDNFKGLVVGKKLSDVSLSKVSGSSLTPKGFNDAVLKIRTQTGV